MIENNPISSLSPKPADEIQPSEKKNRSVEKQPAGKSQDKVELSERAMLLSRATSALGNTAEIQSDRVASITRQVQDGIYQVPVKQLADVLFERLFK